MSSGDGWIIVFTIQLVVWAFLLGRAVEVNRAERESRR